MKVDSVNGRNGKMKKKISKKAIFKGTKGSKGNGKTINWGYLGK